jgi:hypothetical protein
MKLDPSYTQDAKSKQTISNQDEDDEDGDDFERDVEDSNENADIDE